MEDPFSKYLETVIRFVIERSQHFNVWITAYRMKGNKDPELNEYTSKWRWNVYALIFETHPLFKEKKSLIHDLHFSGGITLEHERIIYHKGRDKPFRALKLGSDYQHLWDIETDYGSPLEGVDCRILSDAQLLIDDLKSYIKD